MLFLLLVFKLAVTHHVGLRVVCKVMLGNTHHMRALVEHLKRLLNLALFIAGFAVFVEVLLKNTLIS